MAKTCQKVPYKSREAALADAETIRVARRHFSKKYNNHAKSGRKARPYKCPICGDWHLTTQRKYKRRKKSLLRIDEQDNKD